MTDMESGKKVAATFVSAAAAEAAVRQLQSAGFAAGAVTIAPPHTAPVGEPDMEVVASKTAVRAAAGAAGGVVAASAGAVALAAASSIVVLGAPLLLTAVGIGIVGGASLGGLTSAALTEQQFADLTSEAAAKGYWLVLCEVADEKEQLSAQDVFSRTDAEQTIDHGGAVRTADA